MSTEWEEGEIWAPLAGEWEREDKMSEVKKLFEEWWAPIVMPEGKWDLEQVKRELYDYAILIGNVSEVYDHITGGAISKPNTKVEAVVAVADDLVTQMIQEALAEEAPDAQS